MNRRFIWKRWLLQERGSEIKLLQQKVAQMGDAEGQLRMDLEAERSRTKVLWTLPYKMSIYLLCFQKGFRTR